MFTGLVERVGSLLSVQPEGRGRRLAIRSGYGDGELRAGQSVAVDGICLTAERDVEGGLLEVVAGIETLERTTLPDWRPGRRLHLERALRLGDRLDGHLVQGHVDGTARVERLLPAAETRVLWLRLPAELLRYVAEKGSLAVDGVSLTVNELRGAAVRLNLVPHTWTHTHFEDLRPGQRVNVEVDLLARYVERLLSAGPGPGGLDRERLAENGFL